MRLNKIILGAAAFIAGSLVTAQSISLHGYMDYTNFGVGQKFYKDTQSSDDWEHTDPAAEYGSFYNGRTELNAFASVLNMDFALGVRLDSALGEWYNLYHDNSDDNNNETMFHQMNAKVKFFNDQINFYTGKFEEWNAGYILNGYALGGQNIRDLAQRDNGQHFTGIEWIPNMSVLDGKLVGLRIIAGVPLLPPNSSYYDSSKANSLDLLYKKIKIMGAYKWLRPNIDFRFGFRPGTYYDGIKSDDFDYEENNFTKNYFSEAFVQADLPSLFSGVKLNVTYDIRWRKDDDYTGDVASAHYFGFSGTTSLVPGWTINFENRTFYADDHYLAPNEKLFYDIIGLQFMHNIPGKPYTIGLNLNGMYAQDAKGTGFVNDRVKSSYFDDLYLAAEWMQVADHTIKSGEASRYYGVYAYPYFQKNFSNGFFKTGIEFQYMYETGASDYSGIVYRVPFAFCFWF